MDVPVLMVPLLAKVIVIDFTAVGLRFRMDQQETNKHKNRNLITVRLNSNACCIGFVGKKKKKKGLTREIRLLYFVTVNSILCLLFMCLDLA